MGFNIFQSSQQKHLVPLAGIGSGDRSVLFPVKVWPLRCSMARRRRSATFSISSIRSSTLQAAGTLLSSFINVPQQQACAREVSPSKLTVFSGDQGPPPLV